MRLSSQTLNISILILMYPGEVKYVGHVGEGAPSSPAPGLSGLDRGRLSWASAARRWEGTELLYGSDPRAPNDKEGRCGKDEPREPALHLAVGPLGQARTTTSIVPPNSSPADPGEKKAMGPFGSGLHRKNAALSLQLWVPESWNQQLRSWQPPRRPGQPPP